MSCKYSIVQYFPNPVSGERINIGVVVLSGNIFVSKFIDSWERVERFAINKADLTMLHAFVNNFNKVAATGFLFSSDPNDKRSNLERLEYVATNWHNSIQFTKPRGSLEPINSLLCELVLEFLV